MFALPISKPVLKALFFNQNCPNMKLFSQKNAKFSSAGGSAPRPPCLQRLGALPPNPQPLAAGCFAPRPHWPPAAGGSAPRPSNRPPPLRFSGYALACGQNQKKQVEPHSPNIAQKL